MVGFKQKRVLAMEGKSTPDDLQVMFLSGSNDSLLDIIDVNVIVQLSNESTAIQGINKQLTNTIYCMYIYGICSLNYSYSHFVHV